MAIKVVDTEGYRWRIVRRWVPRRRGETLWSRLRVSFGRFVDRAGGPADEAGGVAGVAMTGADIPWSLALLPLFGLIALVIFVLFALAVFFVEIILLLVVAAFGVALRITLRHPWVVEAVREDGLVEAERVIGWRESSALMHRLALEKSRYIKGPWAS